MRPIAFIVALVLGAVSRAAAQADAGVFRLYQGTQELGREVNTIGSKANDAVITQEVIALKGELEKFREQLENLE